jgi:hypothetical protein
MKKDNYYKAALGISSVMLGLAVYNTVSTRKHREVLKNNNLMGIGEVDQTGLVDDIEKVPSLEEPKVIDETGTNDVVEQASKVADKYFTNMSTNIEVLLKNDKVQNYLKESGISVNVNSVNKERMKNIMAAWGLFSLILLAKNNLTKVGIGAAAFILFTKNREKIEMALQSISADEKLVA